MLGLILNPRESINKRELKEGISNIRKQLGFGDHALDFLPRKTTLLVHRLRLASALVSSRNLHNTIGVNFEGDFDLRNTVRSRRNAVELELAKKVVVLGKRTLTLMDEDSGLVIGSSGEARKICQSKVKTETIEIHTFETSWCG